MFYYSDISHYLDAHLGGYAKETKAGKKAICKMLTFPVPHYHDRYNAFALPVKLMRMIGLSQATFNAKNEKYGFFDCDGWWAEGKCRFLYPTDKLVALLYGAAHSEFRHPTVKYSEVRHGQFRDNTRFDVSPLLRIGELNIQGSVQIDREALKNMEHPDSSSAYQASRILLLSDLKGLDLGELPQAFRVGDTIDRVQGIGVSIQNTHRPIRKAIMTRYNDYDFVNCHYVIAAQNYSSAEAINEYAYNSKKVRKEIAQCVGIEEDTVKMCLLAILNGARMGYSQIHHSMAKLLGPKTKAFYNTHIVQEIYSEADDLAYSILGPDKPRSHLSHYMMNEEARILKAAVGESVIALPMHDGWMTEEEVCVNSSERMIEESTGYRMKIVKKATKHAL